MTTEEMEMEIVDPGNSEFSKWLSNREIIKSYCTSVGFNLEKLIEIKYHIAKKVFIFKISNGSRIVKTYVRGRLRENSVSLPPSYVESHDFVNFYKIDDIKHIRTKPVEILASYETPKVYLNDYEIFGLNYKEELFKSFKVDINSTFSFGFRVPETLYVLMSDEEIDDLYYMWIKHRYYLVKYSKPVPRDINVSLADDIKLKIINLKNIFVVFAFDKSDTQKVFWVKKNKEDLEKDEKRKDI